MLKSLELKNIALIDKATIEFDKGLTVLSGETGSGKSVILDSLNFVLGAKAEKSMIRHGETECSATAVFDVSSCPAVKSVMSDLGLDDSDELIITRKYGDKSVIRVNGEPFTAAMLKSITSLLVDVHGQSEHYSLVKESEQLKVVDRFCGSGLNLEKEKCRQICKKLREIDQRLSEFGGSESDRAIRADILKFQINEIESAELVQGEDEELENRRKIIQNAEKLAEAFNGVKSALDGEDCAIDSVNNAIRALVQISHMDEKYNALAERLKSVVSEMEDVSETAEDYAYACDFDEGEADRVEERLDRIKGLKKKYGPTIEDIEKFCETAKKQYEKLINFDAEYEKCLSEKTDLLKILNSEYATMSKIRREFAKTFSEKVVGQLRELGMKNASFFVDFAPLKETADSPYKENGNDEIEFMFSANLGEPVKPLSKIISGGEMSRFMLALKTIISDYQEIYTYLFDEIDVGISGKIADTVAKKFALIAKNTQVIAISHLPQITAFSDSSVLIEKKEDSTKTYTTVRSLKRDEKISEIVRMTGGDMESEISVLHAKELLNKAEEYKKSM